MYSLSLLKGKAAIWNDSIQLISGDAQHIDHWQFHSMDINGLIRSFLRLQIVHVRVHLCVKPVHCRRGLPCTLPTPAVLCLYHISFCNWSWSISFENKYIKEWMVNDIENFTWPALCQQCFLWLLGLETVTNCYPKLSCLDAYTGISVLYVQSTGSTPRVCRHPQENKRRTSYVTFSRDPFENLGQGVLFLHQKVSFPSLTQDCAWLFIR